MAVKFDGKQKRVAKPIMYITVLTVREFYAKGVLHKLTGYLKENNMVMSKWAKEEYKKLVNG